MLTRRCVDGDVNTFGNCLKAETAVVEYPFYGARNDLNGLLKRQLSIIELTKDSIEVFLEETLRGVRLLDLL